MTTSLPPTNKLPAELVLLGGDEMDITHIELHPFDGAHQQFLQLYPGGGQRHHLRPGRGMGSANVVPRRFREDPRGHPQASALLAAIDSRIRSPRRVATAVQP